MNYDLNFNNVKIHTLKFEDISEVMPKLPSL